ncbi:gp054 [Rhodococcus phage ReqiPepy6]|uniref:Gp054 n=1 Tax=Rhodococcus phage ReqiPepy6 TaxID=691965 RepID=D4P7G5_9CAUD|nr:gp054 [Rhodococcus phage ReqiPepy6]ADD80945.1 gp054 [Rhodococcus phage ReqiPepy6]
MLSSTISVLWDILLVFLLIIGIIIVIGLVTGWMAVVWTYVTRFVNAYRRASRELEAAEELERVDDDDPYGKLVD